ncbi:hypothetical protein ACWEQG_08110 [Microbispora sp. NPDC004025]
MAGEVIRASQPSTNLGFREMITSGPEIPAEGNTRPWPVTARRVVLIELLAMVFSFAWERVVSVAEERAGGAGRDRPESRMPGRLAARRASRPPQAGRLEPVKKL